ncbi:hypothetical protein Tco_0305280 [Tanacetum coccineum]
MSIRTQAPNTFAFLFEEVAERVLALPTPPPSPLSPYSSPLPRIPSYRHYLYHHYHPLNPTNAEGISGDPELLRPCRTTPGPGYEVGESSAAGTARQFGPTTASADLYGFADTLEAAPGRRMSRELGYEDEIIYSQLDDARYDRALLRARVNMLESDRPFHRRTAVLMEEEARLSRAAWAHPDVELQSADQRRQTVISELLKADYRRQRQLVETLKIVKSLKTQMIELQRQQGPAKDPAEPELPEEASSSS